MLSSQNFAIMATWRNDFSLLFFPANRKRGSRDLTFLRLPFAGRSFNARRTFFPFGGNAKTCVFAAHWYSTDYFFILIAWFIMFLLNLHVLFVKLNEFQIWAKKDDNFSVLFCPLKVNGRREHLRWCNIGKLILLSLKETLRIMETFSQYLSKFSSILDNLQFNFPSFQFCRVDGRLNKPQRKERQTTTKRLANMTCSPLAWCFLYNYWSRDHFLNDPPCKGSKLFVSYTITGVNYAYLQQ